MGACNEKASTCKCATIPFYSMQLGCPIWPLSWYSVLTHWVAAARQTAVAGCVPVVVVQAALAVGAVCVVGAVAAVASVAGGAVQLGVKVALDTLAITVAS